MSKEKIIELIKHLHINAAMWRFLAVIVSADSNTTDEEIAENKKILEVFKDVFNDIIEHRGNDVMNTDSAKHYLEYTEKCLDCLINTNDNETVCSSESV